MRIQHPTENGLRTRARSYRESSGPSVIIVHRPESTQPLLLKQGCQFDLRPGGDVREHAQFAAAGFLGWHGHGIQVQTDSACKIKTQLLKL